MWVVLVCSILFRGGHAAPGIVDVCSSMSLRCRLGFLGFRVRVTQLACRAVLFQRF